MDVQGEYDRGLCDIEITEKIVLEKLDGLRDDKAAGADDLVPRVLLKAAPARPQLMTHTAPAPV